MPPPPPPPPPPPAPSGNGGARGLGGDPRRPSMRAVPDRPPQLPHAGSSASSSATGSEDSLNGSTRPGGRQHLTINPAWDTGPGATLAPASLVGPGLSSLSRNGSLNSLVITPKAVGPTREAARRNSVFNMSAAPSRAGSLTNVGPAAAASPSDGPSPFTSNSALPPIAGTRPADRSRARALWELIRTFVSRRFFTTFMTGTAVNDGNAYYTQMQTTWAALREQQRRVLSRIDSARGSSSSSSDDDSPLFDSFGFGDESGSDYDEEDNGPGHDLRPSTSTGWDRSSNALAGGPRAATSSGSSSGGLSSTASDLLAGMSLDRLRDPAPFDLANTLALIIQGLQPHAQASTNGNDWEGGRGPATDANGNPVPAANDASGGPPGAASAASSRTSELYFAQQHHLTAWRIMVLSLRMSESAHRRLGLAALAAVAPALQQTCIDNDTRDMLAEALLAVTVGDERLTNRLHAIHVLGDLYGLYLRTSEDDAAAVLASATHGATGGGGSISARVFQALIKMLHEIQCRERRMLEADLGAELASPAAAATAAAAAKLNREQLVVKMYLFSALGKFLKSEIEPEWIKATVLYMIWAELEYIFPTFRHLDEYLGMMEVIMRILTSIQGNETNRTFMGAMFKSRIQPLMIINRKKPSATDPPPALAEALQRLAVQFTALWLPITRDGANASAWTMLLEGMRYLPDPTDSTVATDRSLLNARLRDEASRSVTRTRVLWQLLQMPSLTCRLQRVPGAPRGWFATPDESVEMDQSDLGGAGDVAAAASTGDSAARATRTVSTCNMPLTSGIAVYLPDGGTPTSGTAARHALHSDTIVYITRPLPPLPGVPTNATTQPPIFMDPSWASKVATSAAGQYEAAERTGRVPCLPAGYTYSPAPLPAATAGSAAVAVPQGKVLASPRPTEGRAGIRIGVGMNELPPPRKVPFGFVTRPINVDVSAVPADGSTGDGSVGGAPGVIRRPSMAITLSKANLALQRTRSRVQTVEEEDEDSGNHGSGGDDDDEDHAAEYGEGYTAERIPAVFPVASGTLMSQTPDTEFLLHAPVILDIVEPSRARRVAARIVSINKCFEPVAVNNAGYLSPGARFNLHIRPRKANRGVSSESRRASVMPPEAALSRGASATSLAGSRGNLAASRGSLSSAAAAQAMFGTAVAASDPPSLGASFSSRGGGGGGGNVLDVSSRLSLAQDLDAMGEDEEEWITVQLQVEEDTSGSVEVLRSSQSSLVPPPVVSCGLTQDGTAFFTPPCNLSPLPVGYTRHGEAFYAMPPPLRPIPAGLLADGKRYFHAGAGAGVAWDSTAATPHGLAGFDYRGQPYFVPKGCKIPAPSGYTAYGVPYYDISTILLERGILMENREYAPSATLNWSHPLKMIQNQTTVADSDAVWQPEPGHEFAEPRGIQFIRELEDLAYLHPPGIKTALEPGSLHFQSVTGVVTRPCILKFRALRGDHSERDYFFTVEPMDVFSVDVFHVRLQGEGMVQVKVSCHSSRIKFQHVEGSLSLIDETGRRLVSCKLTGTRKSFVRVYPLSVHCGWVMPNASSTFSVTCENISNSLIHLGFRRPSNSFYMAEDTLKLQSKEAKSINVTFEPQVVGAYDSMIQVEAPGGETITVHVAGVCGVPLALHTESPHDSALGPDVLARERSSFVSRVFKLLESGESVLAVTERFLHGKDEQDLFSSLLYAMDPVGRRRNNLCIDFGLLELPKSDGSGGVLPSASLCLTLFNVSTEPLTCSLFSTSTELEFDHLVRIAPHKANSVRIEVRPRVTGEFCAVIALTCPGFATIPCLVRGYVGCPVFIAALPSVWMPPAEPKGIASVSLPVINMSNAPVEATIEITSACGRFRVAGVPMLPAGIASTPLPAITSSSSTGAESGSTVVATVRVASYSVQNVEFECTDIGESLERAFVNLSVGALRSTSITLLCMPMWLGLVKQDLESLVHWMHQSTQAAPQPPHHAPPPLINNVMREAPPAGAAPRLRLPCAKMVSQQLVSLSNPGPQPIQAHLVLSPGFAIAKQSSSVVRVNPSDSVHLQCAFKTEYVLANHGFLLAYAEKYLPIMIPLVSSPLLTVCPLPTGSTNDLVLDFGTIESGTARTSPWCIRSALLANTRESSVMWTCRIITNRSRHIPFDVLTPVGDLRPMQCELIKFDVNATVQGTFDATCELVAKEHMTAPPVVVCSIILRVHVVLTQVLGIPDSYDFGSCVVGSNQSHSFILENIGNVTANVALLPKSPFDISPSSFELPTGGQQSVTLTYSPTESSKDSVNRIACFINHKVATIRVLGKSGFVELASNNHHNLLDFGSVSSTCISWMNVYVTNRGTLPLRLDHIVSPRPEILSLELIGRQLMVRPSTYRVKRDGWSILKSKIKALALIGHFLRHKLKTVVAHGASPEASVNRATAMAAASRARRQRFPIAKGPGVNLADLLGGDDDLILEPMNSFLFRIGFSTVHQTRQTTELSFYYTPVVSNKATATSKKLTFTVTGFIYRVLDFHPHSIDFGLVPVAFAATSLRQVLASSGSESSAQRNRNDDNIQTLRISNMSIETQSISLLLSTSSGSAKVMVGSNHNLNGGSGAIAHHTPSTGSSSSASGSSNSGAGTMLSAFRLEGRTWTLGPGESVRVPVKFLPAKPQTQYRGEALLQHSHGITIVRFSGTGASAEIVHGTRVNFGAVSMNQQGRAKLVVYNKGLLPAVVHCQMMEAGVFRFDSSDPFDLERVLEAGSAMDVNLVCMCTQQIPSIVSTMRVNWRRSPHEPTESTEVVLSVDVGYPMFAVDQMELDFGVTYTKNVQELRIRNDGNAACNWSIAPNMYLRFNHQMGVLLPQSAETIEVVFQPTCFDPLEANVEFITDAGTKVVLAYGIVGIPYLKIPEEYMLVDFGIIEIDEDHVLEVPFANTGAKQIEYSLELHHHASSDEAPVFSISPDRGYIDGNSTVTITITARPSVFARVSSCTWIVRTTDGERYDGGISCVGGQAIVIMSKLFDSDSRPSTGLPIDDPSAPPQEPAEDPASRARTATERFVSQASVAMKEHVSTLKDITINLSSDDAKELEAQVRALDQLRQTKAKQSLTTLGTPPSRPGSNQRPGSTRTPPQRLYTPASGTTTPNGGPRAPPRSRSPLQNMVSRGDDLGGSPTSPLPPIGGPNGSRPGTSSRPGTQQSMARQRWMEGTLFNLRDVQKPIDELYTKGEELFRRLSAQFRQLTGQGSADGAAQDGGHDADSHTAAAASRDRFGSSSMASMSSMMDGASSNAASTDELHLRNRTPHSRLHTRGDPSHRPVTPLELQQHIEETKRATELLQQHIPHVTESKHVHILADAVDHIVSSTRRLEQALYVPDEPAQSAAPSAASRNRIKKTFDLGLLKGGDHLEDYALFDLPNMGNMPFPFTTTVTPASMRPYFSVKPVSHVVQPGTRVPITLTFQAMDEGDYAVEIAIVSKEQTIIAVAAKAKVGIPKIEVQQGPLKFGLVLRGTSAVLPFTIRNVGSYRDSVDLVLDSPSFALEWTGRAARLQPGTEIQVPIKFTPRTAEAFTAKWMIFPLSQAPFPVILEGEGAAPEIKATPTRLSFGSVFVGVAKRMSVQLANNGNWEAILLPRLTNPLFSLHVGDKALLPGDMFTIAARSTAALDVTMQAAERADVTANLVIEETLTKERATVQLTGFTGKFDALVEGELNFGNLRVEELASRPLVVKNAGDFAAVVRCTLEPAELADAFTVTRNDKLMAINAKGASGADEEIAAGAELTLTVNTCPKSSRTITGALTVLVSCTVDGTVQERSFEYPFSFYAFDNPVVVDNHEASIDIGVWAVGKATEWSLSSTNFDNQPVVVRARIEPLPPPAPAPAPGAAAAAPAPEAPAAKGKEKAGGKKPAGKKKKDAAADAKAAEKEVEKAPVYQSCWTLPMPQMTLETGQSGMIKAVFAASDAPEMTQDAILWVEFTNDGGKTYVPLHRYLLKGKSGRPKVEISTPSIDFGFVPCGCSEVRDVVLTNTGTASTEWEVEKGWSNDDIFTLVECPSEGVIHPGDAITLRVQFNASVTFEFSSEITVAVSGAEEKLKLALHGQGCVYRIYAPGLPKDVQLAGQIHGREAAQFSFPIANDCVFNVPLEFSIECAEHPDMVNYLTISPPQMTLLGNMAAEVSAGARQTLTATLSMAPVLTTSIDQVAQLATSGLRYLVFVRSTSLSDVYTIPVRVEFLANTLSVDTGTVALGDVPFDAQHVDAPVAIHNPNPFPLPVTIASSHPMVLTNMTSVEIGPESSVDLVLTLIPKEYANEAEIPAALTVAATITVTCTQLGQSDTVEFTARMVDVNEPPEFPDIDFGPVFIATAKEKPLSFKNWGRRPLDYQIMLPSGDLTSTGFEPPQQSLLKGTVASRSNIEIPFVFRPTRAAAAQMAITLVTSLGAFSFSILATGISPTVAMSPAVLDFGLIGVGFPETRPITVKNESPLPVYLALKLTTVGSRPSSASGGPSSNTLAPPSSAGGEMSSRPFTPSPTTVFRFPPTLHLEAGQTETIDVEFHPLAPDLIMETKIVVTTLGSTVATSDVRGRTGRFGLKTTTDPPILTFAPVEVMELATTAVEFVNTGEIPVLVAFADDNGEPMKPGKELVGKNNIASFGCKPASHSLDPGQSAKFTLSVTGMRDGADERAIKFVTPNLVNPVTFEFAATATVNRAVDIRNLQSFSKADSSIDEKLSMDVIERPKFKSDEGIWRVLLPMVKINAKTPGLDGEPLPIIPAIEPHLGFGSIVHQLVRPPAIPSAQLPADTLTLSGGLVSKQAGASRTSLMQQRTMGGGGLKRGQMRTATQGSDTAAPNTTTVDPTASIVPAVLARMQSQREALAALAPLERSVFGKHGGDRRQANRYK
ncbi:hypothetical protein H9P43_005670 [Blastocladiella emersonii ATCC 22665]|nr:hypothetical protein H9P43_005670 [Blastocladiella emersonii ATCC 22665]